MPFLPALSVTKLGSAARVWGRSSNATIALSSLNGLSNSSSTWPQLVTQWTHPSDVLSVLLIIGGDIVQTALAQTTGGWFTPVCFSFGWVAYSFTALINIIGDGRLLPQPDYPVKVFNLDSGYTRENKNWVIGRLLRDNEAFVSKDQVLGNDALRISIYEALPVRNSKRLGSSQVFGLCVMLLQLGIASIPLAIDGYWGVLLVTATGTCLALIAGALPQWKAEKLPNRQNTKKTFALTSGNGSRDIMIIRGSGFGLDLEELSASESPRTGRPWEKFPLLSTTVRDPEGRPLRRVGSEIQVREARELVGFPAGFWITRIICALQSACWLALLITVSGLKSNTWYLLLVGGIGMFQNAVLAAIERRPAQRKLPMVLKDTIKTKKVMDGLMDLEVTYPGFGQHLAYEFFPGKLRKQEEEWWLGRRDSYDDERCKSLEIRGVPRSRLMATPEPQPSPNLAKSGEKMSPRSTGLIDHRQTRRKMHDQQKPSSPTAQFALRDVSRDSIEYPKDSQRAAYVRRQDIEDTDTFSVEEICNIVRPPDWA
ncbi:hypothetical protein D0Z07_5528 [Hyphodiscus hymeniophilus]|uniref:Uncharacterized protein n=1 Tax=Hyphodiscus hymeniophilus TaxID=353542 RepID=A0A9P7AWC5_9HELO|nr:hypothetical protein D0Z07_5528 [Hyphodiscus hymeniophilus]